VVSDVGIGGDKGRDARRKKPRGEHRGGIEREEVVRAKKDPTMLHGRTSFLDKARESRRAGQCFEEGGKTELFYRGGAYKKDRKLGYVK